MIQLTTTQWRSAKECAEEDHDSRWEMTGHPADECGDSVVVVDWFHVVGELSWLRCVIPDTGDPRYYLTQAAPIGVRIAAGLSPDNSAI